MTYISKILHFVRHVLVYFLSCNAAILTLHTINIDNIYYYSLVLGDTPTCLSSSFDFDEKIASITVS